MAAVMTSTAARVRDLRTAVFGVTRPGPLGAVLRIQARKDAASDAHRICVENRLKQIKNCAVFGGHAGLEFERELRVGEDTTAVDQIIIPVGGHAPAFQASSAFHLS
jgi:hypothetical protein